MVKPLLRLIWALILGVWRYLRVITFSFVDLRELKGWNLIFCSWTWWLFSEFLIVFLVVESVGLRHPNSEGFVGHRCLCEISPFIMTYMSKRNLKWILTPILTWHPLSHISALVIKMIINSFIHYRFLIHIFEWFLKLLFWNSFKLVELHYSIFHIFWLVWRLEGWAEVKALVALVPPQITITLPVVALPRDGDPTSLIDRPFENEFFNGLLIHIVLLRPRRVPIETQRSYLLLRVTHLKHTVLVVNPRSYTILRMVLFVRDNLLRTHLSDWSGCLICIWCRIPVIVQILPLRDQHLYVLLRWHVKPVRVDRAEGGRRWMRVFWDLKVIACWRFINLLVGLFKHLDGTPFRVRGLNSLRGYALSFRLWLIAEDQRYGGTRMGHAPGMMHTMVVLCGERALDSFDRGMSRVYSCHNLK